MLHYTVCGTFQVPVLASFLVTDPCYAKSEVDLWLSPVHPGTWTGRIGYEAVYGGEVAVVEAACGEFPVENWEFLDEAVPVDSGQAGIFLTDLYPEGESTGDIDYPGTFYGKVYKLTSGTDLGGVLEGGIVSQSGPGDGRYDAAVGRNREGAVVAVRIFFSNQKEEDELEEEKSLRWRTLVAGQ